MSFSLSENDDDLFDYDPSLETSTSFTSSETDSVPTSLSNEQVEHEKQFIENIKNNISFDLDTDLTGENGKVNNITSNLYGSFQEAINAFINTIRHDNFIKSAHITLDRLTNGQFSLINLFYQYEMKISRKLALVELFAHIVKTEENEDVASFLRELSSVLRIDVSKLYYNATFCSTVNILNHSLSVDRIVYRFLSNKTQIPVNEALINGLNLQNSTNTDVLMRSMELVGFQENINNQMFTAFLSAEPNGEQQTLSEMLQEVFNSPVSYINTFKTM